MTTAQTKALQKRPASARPGEPRPEFGPAMRALHPRWRKCVEMLFLAQGNQTQALRLAGYEGTSDSLNTMAWRLFSDERVRKALREECNRRVDTLEPEVMSITLEIVRDLATKPADRLRAAAMLWDRSNPLMTKSLHQVQVEHHLSEPEREIQHYRALKNLGAPQEAFLQRFGPNGLPRVAALVLAEESKRRQIEGDVVDAEYAEIEPAASVSSGIVDEDLE